MCPKANVVARISSGPRPRLTLTWSFRTFRSEFSGGTTTSDDGEMAAEHREYWGTIYQSPSNDLRDSIPMRRYDPMRMQDLLRYTEKRLTEAQWRRLDAPMTAQDFYDAILKSPKGKSARLMRLTEAQWRRLDEPMTARDFYDAILKSPKGK
ncbi:hypothetical protein PsorP6_013948 [Peronosclerospora sorghi]|uniref:Uncharacterized protein n=1 Tax=Peronosclerospora sorghi TaxID=230839 RepID=A0ACC0VH96_9STRA|nr:hypothetical protein PsorP6_013948 [Peronosclerospora sorghi]